LAKSGGLDCPEALIRQYQTKQQGPQHAEAKERGDTDFLNQAGLDKKDLVRIQALAHRASTEFIQSVQTRDCKIALLVKSLSLAFGTVLWCLSRQMILLIILPHASASRR